MRDPKTAEEWQAAVDGSNFLLRYAEVFGTVCRDGFAIDAARCREIVEAGRAIGFEPCDVGEYLKRELGA
jgi:hypothetical protein